MFLFQLLSEIPTCVHEALKDYSSAEWYAKPYLYVKIFFAALKGWFPYNRALTQIAYMKYQETTMYRERLVNFNEEFAMMQFVENREYEYFKAKITREEKIRAFFLPFDYIRRL